VASDPSTPDLPIRLQGQLLLADPSLRDGVFTKAVVLLTDHDPENGAAGLILNSPTGQRVGDVLPPGELAPLRKLEVHCGGPVAPDQLTFSAFWWSRKALRWNLRIAADAAVELCHRPGTIVRAFVGYSGWSAGQLEGELRQRAWIAVRAQKEILGHEHDRALWGSIMRQISPLHRVLAEAPDNPLLN
jgi:putative transcriptional regulator